MRLIIEDYDQRFGWAKSLQSIQALLLHKAFLSLIVKWSAAKLTLEYRFVCDRDLFKTPSEIKAGEEVPQGLGREYGEMNMLACWVWVEPRDLKVSFKLTSFFLQENFTAQYWAFTFFIIIFIFFIHHKVKESNRHNLNKFLIFNFIS